MSERIAQAPTLDELRTAARCATGYPVSEGLYSLVLATDAQLQEDVGARWRSGETTQIPAQSIAVFGLA